MSKFTFLALVSTVLFAMAPGAEARKNPGNPLVAPTLLDATLLAAGDGECDGDDTTTDDVCLSVTFVKVCEATKYSVDLTKGFDTDGDTCNDTSISDNTSVDAEACTGTLNCEGDTLECQTAVVPLGTTTICVDDGDLTVDCVNDLEDVEVGYLSLCAKVKGLNPAQKGPKAVSQSTPFSDTICAVTNDQCI
ncbi:MAG: hypothetical protein ABR587_07585 [Candidatus Binatia bacterium]